MSKRATDYTNDAQQRILNLVLALFGDVVNGYLYQALAPEHEVYLRYKAADRELAAIADGDAVLACPWGGTPGTLVAGSAPGEGEVLFGFSPRRVTDDDMRGYA